MTTPVYYFLILILTNLIKKYNSKGIRIKVATKQVIITNSHTKK